MKENIAVHRSLRWHCNLPTVVAVAEGGISGFSEERFSGRLLEKRDRAGYRAMSLSLLCGSGRPPSRVQSPPSPSRLDCAILGKDGRSGVMFGEGGLFVSHVISID